MCPTRTGCPPTAKNQHHLSSDGKLCARPKNKGWQVRVWIGHNKLHQTCEIDTRLNNSCKVYKKGRLAKREKQKKAKCKVLVATLCVRLPCSKFLSLRKSFSSTLTQKMACSHAVLYRHPTDKLNPYILYL